MAALSLRQLRAFAWLMVLAWRRGPLGQQKVGKKGVFLLRLVGVAFFAHIGFRQGAILRDFSESKLHVALAVSLLGAFSTAATYAFQFALPQVRGIRHPLEVPLLDALPVRERSRVTIFAALNIAAYALTFGLLAGVRPQAPTDVALFGLLMGAAGSLSGIAVTRMLRVLLRPVWLARVGSVSFVFVMVSIFTVSMGPTLATTGAARWLAVPLLPVSRAIVDGHGHVFAVCTLISVALCAVVAIGICERVGYDRTDVTPTPGVSRSRAEDLTVARVERLLAKRAPGGRLAPLFIVSINLVFASSVTLAWVFGSSATVLPDLPRFALGLLTFQTVVHLLGHADQAIMRDLSARPLLSPLPMAPRDLLAGKERALRRQALMLFAPTVLFLLYRAPWQDYASFVARLGACAAAVWLFTRAAIAVNFLSVGAGTGPRGATPFRLETWLLFGSAMGVALAPYAWSAWIGVGALALLAHESHRGAMQVAEWLDDPEDIERRPSTWRAILAFSAFQAFQMLSTQLFGFFGEPRAWQAAVTYAASAILLVGMTRYGAKDRLSARFWTGSGDLGLGVLGGALSGAMALAYVHVLHRAGIDLPTPERGLGGLALAVAMVLVAPFAEELFFRGWLQSAVKEQYGGAWRPILITAFAFAAVHPPLSFAPVLVLGIVAGWLFARTKGLVAGSVAHLVHNATALAAAWWWTG